MQHYEKILSETLNFSSKKSRVYLSLLELGETDSASIAKKSGLKRTTVYNILPELVAEGFVKSCVSRGKRKFYIDSPNALESDLDDKKSRVTSIVPELKSLQGLFHNRPRITFYEGEQGFKEVYKDFIKSSSPGDTVCAYVSTADYYSKLPMDFIIEYANKRVAKKIRLKLIADSSENFKEIKIDSEKFLRELRLVDESGFDFSGETVIYANKVAFISYRENFFGVIIESKEISAMQRAAFNLLWKRLG